MSEPWFFVDALPAPGERWMLSRDEAKHAMGSKRLGPGDAVVLFDGAGRIARASLGSERLRDGSLPVQVHQVERVDRVGREVHLATALPKGDRLSTLIDMTAQLGVASVTPLACERSVVGETDARADRMRRVQIEACKQARCPWLPTLHHEQSVDEVIASSRAARRSLAIFHPGGAPAATAPLGGEGKATVVCIGPEGGFSSREIEALRSAGASVLSLGSTILRIETAAVVAVALMRER